MVQTHRLKPAEAGVLLVCLLGLVCVMTPLLAGADGEADLAQCTDGMRCLGAAFIMYADDWDGLLPDWQPPITPTYDCWHTDLWEGGYVKSDACFVCPAETDAMAVYEANEGLPPEDQQAYGTRAGYSDIEWPRVITYFAHERASSIEMWGPERLYPPLGRGNDAELMLLMEGGSCCVYDAATANEAWQWVGLPERSRDRTDARHIGMTDVRPGTFNVLWLDGRVTNTAERMVRTELNLNRDWHPDAFVDPGPPPREE